MQAHLSHRLVAGSVVATSALSVALFLAEAAPGPKAAVELTKAGVPKSCRVHPSATRELADQDHDGRPEQLIRCQRKNDSEEVQEPGGESYRSKPCESVYLVSSRGRAELLADFCPGPHGARALGDDEIRIRGSTLIQAKSGGSSWTWSRTCELDLTPPRVRRAEQQGGWILCDGNTEQRTIDYQKGTERVEWSSPLCAPEGSEETCPSQTFQGASLGIPVLDVSALPSSIQGLPAGDSRCLLSLSNGHEVRGSGKHGGATDAQVELWARDDGHRLELWAHLRDDHWVSGSAKWLADDHLELWLADRRFSYQDHCVPPQRVRSGLTQYVILPGAQPTTPGGGSASPRPEARVLSFGEKRSEGVAASTSWLKDGSLLVRIELGAAARKRAREGGISVAYSDGDDGKRQKYLLATSRVRFDDARTLGELARPVCLLDSKGQLVYQQPTSCTKVIE